MLLHHKERALRAYCEDAGLPMVNPVMLVIAKDTAEAEHYQSVLDSASFDNGNWVGNPCSSTPTSPARRSSRH
jgi:type III restriction enzyme